MLGHIIPWVRTHGYNEPSLRDETIVFAYHQSINHIRDKRSPKPKSETVSRVMSANCDTSPELAIRQAFYHTGHRGNRINYRINPPSSHSDA